jgi:hypothetical protein
VTIQTSAGNGNELNRAQLVLVDESICDVCEENVVCDLLLLKVESMTC